MCLAIFRSPKQILWQTRHRYLAGTLNFLRALGSILSMSGGGGGGGKQGVESKIDPTVVPILMPAMLGTIVLGGLKYLKTHNKLFKSTQNFKILLMKEIDFLTLSGCNLGQLQYGPVSSLIELLPSLTAALGQLLQPFSSYFHSVATVLAHLKYKFSFP